MKHLKRNRKFSRKKNQREALLKIMLGDLLKKKRIKTTLAKAKELKIIAEKTISQLKDPKKLRIIKSKLPRDITPAIIKNIAAKTASRKSGFARVIKNGARRSDGAPLAIVKIVEDETIIENKKQ